MLSCSFSETFLLLGVLWASWICDLVSSIWGKFCSCFNISSVPFSPLLLAFVLLSYIFCSCPETPDILDFFFLQFFFSLLFSFGDFYRNSLKLKYSFLSCVQSTNKPIKGILHFHVFFISRISFEFSLRISISLLTLSICSCMLFYPLVPLPY